jgi:hypothetical protein
MKNPRGLFLQTPIERRRNPNRSGRVRFFADSIGNTEKALHPAHLRTRVSLVLMLLLQHIRAVVDPPPPLWSIEDGSESLGARKKMRNNGDPGAHGVAGLRLGTRRLPPIRRSRRTVDDSWFQGSAWGRHVLAAPPPLSRWRSKSYFIAIDAPARDANRC